MSMIKRSVGSIEVHIAKLKQKPIENAKLIKKWERVLRKMHNEATPF